MIPLRDSNAARGFPVVTKVLILVNVLVFLWELSLGGRLPVVFLHYAVIPARYTHPTEAARFFGAFPSLGAALVPFFSSMFLHGGWLHLLGNVWVLWIFGDNVEWRLGHVRFLLLYLASGLVAAFLHVATNVDSPAPTLGASGAIAGVMGAYFRFFPTSRLEVILPPFFLGPTFELPAMVFLGFWFLLQFFNGAFSLAEPAQHFSGIAWWAHVGGFLFGAGVCAFAGRRRRPGWFEDR